jgi:hypothetical protein
MNIKVSSTNGQDGKTNFVRVYIDGIKVAEVTPPKRNPLAYLKAHKKSKYWDGLEEQLLEQFEPYQVGHILEIIRNG